MTLAFSKVAIIGAGAMGRGIAQIAAQAGSQVWLFDTQSGASAKAREAWEGPGGWQPPMRANVLRLLSGHWVDVLALSVSTDRQLPALRILVRQARQISPNPKMTIIAGGPLALSDPQALQARLAQFRAASQRGEGMRVLESQLVQASGAALLALWRDFALDMAERWQALDPRQRVEWAGPSMSARSSITARQMETWAHGQALFDLQGRDRPESARLLNIVVLGVNTFGWSHSVRGQAVPPAMPRVELTGPAGEDWHFGESGPAGLVQGSALGFAQVVTQTRHVLDTDLQIRGEVAAHWMAHAQCFAGAAEPPPTPGSRHKVIPQGG